MVCLQNEPALFKQLLPISSILSGIRAHFWESPAPESLKQAYGGALSVEELREVRRGLLDTVGVLLKAAATQQNAVSNDDVQVDLLTRHCLCYLTCVAMTQQNNRSLQELQGLQRALLDIVGVVLTTTAPSVERPQTDNVQVELLCDVACDAGRRCSSADCLPGQWRSGRSQVCAVRST